MEARGSSRATTMVLNVMLQFATEKKKKKKVMGTPEEQRFIQSYMISKALTIYI